MKSSVVVTKFESVCLTLWTLLHEGNGGCTVSGDEGFLCLQQKSSSVEILRRRVGV